VDQYRLGVEGWAGTVVMEDWSGRPPSLAASFAHRYRVDRVERPHVHGTNLAVRPDAYLRAGGYPSIPTGEDHGLWQALVATGAHVVHDLTCPVITSSRVDAVHRWASLTLWTRSREIWCPEPPGECRTARW
jgi:hypothetical protein